MEFQESLGYKEREGDRRREEKKEARREEGKRTRDDQYVFWLDSCWKLLHPDALGPAA